MGQRPCDFYHLTFAEFSDIIDTYFEKLTNRRNDQLALAWNIANWTRARELPPFESVRIKSKAMKQKEPQTTQQMFDMIRCLNAALGGKEVIIE
jgi:hypothetical protein